MLLKLLVWFIQFSPFTKRWFWKKWYTLFPKLAPDTEFKCMNFGFFSENLNLDLLEQDEVERYPIQLYHHVSTQVEISGKTVIEVGSGRGGGASYVSRYLKPKKITAVDISNTAINFCRSLYKEENLEFLQGNSEDLPFENESCDVVINVESSHCYGSMDIFLSEVKRVLKHQGYFLFCDLRTLEMAEVLSKQFQQCGLLLIKKNDITANVIHGLEKMSDSRKRKIKNSVPWIARSIFESYAGVTGSKTYESFVDGSFVYISAVLQKTK